MSKYGEYGHRVQTCIAANPDKRPLEPKHLRVGIDMSKADMKGLVDLLIAKGVFTKEEYLVAIEQSAKEEAELHEEDLNRKMGLPPGTISTM